ncbi:hypothetical protein GGS26DRAFT_594184 [Hypomontagnella submonticulosa]|nr:hypothetical protein GGS26DRAFT_594184 [Hypomontagnella submonticulosa]
MSFTSYPLTECPSVAWTSSTVVLLRVGRHLWYMTLLTITVFVLEVICDQVTKQPDYTALWKQFKDSGPVDKFGGNPSPATYCFFDLRGIKFAPNFAEYNLLNVKGLSWTTSLLIYPADL